MASLILPMPRRVTATSQLPGRSQKTRSSDQCGTFQRATAPTSVCSRVRSPGCKMCNDAMQIGPLRVGQLLILELVTCNHMEHARVYDCGVHYTSSTRSSTHTKSLTSAVYLLAGYLLPTGRSLAHPACCLTFVNTALPQFMSVYLDSGC